MADLNALRIPASADDVLVVGTGGSGRTRSVWRDGAATDAVVERDGAAVHRLSGVAVSVGGTGLDGAVVETTTPLDVVPAGTVFRAEGAVEVSVRSDVRAGFAGRGPRGVLVVTVYAQRLIPVGNVGDLVRQPASAASSKRSGE